MAISRPMAKILLSEKRVRPFHGSVLQLGRQTVLFTERELRHWASEAKVMGTNGNGSGYKLGIGSDPAATHSMRDEEFFRFLGFEEVVSCDVSAYENATLIVDLNVPVPVELHNRFDVIYDGGTMEHIFNVPAVLANIDAMLKIGGRVIHVAPASNMVDHGFYCFSPTLFADYYQANGHRLRTLYLFECTSWTGNWDVYDCLAGGLNNRLGRVSTPKMSGVFCIAEKERESKAQIVPSQGYFSRLWSSTSVSSIENGNGTNGLEGVIKAQYPNLAELFYRARALAWKTVPGRGSAMPPFVGRF